MIIHPPEKRGWDEGIEWTISDAFRRRAQTDFALLCAACRGGPMHTRKRIVDSVRVSCRPEIISIDPATAREGAQDKSASRFRSVRTQLPRRSRGWRESIRFLHFSSIKIADKMPCNRWEATDGGRGYDRLANIDQCFDVFAPSRDFAFKRFMEWTWCVLFFCKFLLFLWFFWRREEEEILFESLFDNIRNELNCKCDDQGFIFSVAKTWFACLWIIIFRFSLGILWELFVKDGFVNFVVESIYTIFNLYSFLFIFIWI